MNEYDHNNLNEILKIQKDYYFSNGQPSIKKRLDRLNRIKELVIDNRYDFIETLNADYGGRSKEGSLMSDIYSIIPSVNHAIKNINKWTKPVKRSSNFPFNILGAKSSISYEPLGTVGVISPWNFPVYLSFAPMASIFAAGNQVMHKPSEHTPRTSRLIKTLSDKYFDIEEVATFNGGPEVGDLFTKLKFDHLLFTGGGEIAKKVMKNAAENLVPITLELGGKSPVIVSKSANIEVAAKRILFGKTFNAGQICLAPDYVFVHEEIYEDFLKFLSESTKEFFPSLDENNDYSSIVNSDHFNRINNMLIEARENNVEIIQPVKFKNEDNSRNKIPPTFLINPAEHLKIMQSEIFGPVMPIFTYKSLDDPISYINTHDKPLGLYYFGNNKKEEKKLLSNTSSGGVTINNVISHIQQVDLPFGGVGDSGIGSYDSYDGFKNFSNQRVIYRDINTKLDSLFKVTRPPYKGNIEKALKSLLK